MTRLKLSTLAVAVALTQAASASDYSNTIFFGDSLTDSGAYFGSSFTTNPSPVWAEVLAESMGYQATSSVSGGTNYAQGGARVSQQPGVGSGPALEAVPVDDQVANYLASTGGSADANALYSVWAGANDIFYAVGALDSSAITGYLQTTATEQVQVIAGLKAAGARYVLVPNLPDMGLTPDGVASGAAGSASLTQLSEYYNNALFSQLAAANIEVIPVDMMGMLREVTASPATYGFSNTTDKLCGENSSLLCNAGVNFSAGQENEYVYADGVHPTGGAHNLISDYVNSILSAPAFARQLSRSALYQQRALSQNLFQQLDGGRTLANGELIAWGNVSAANNDWDDVNYDGDGTYSTNAGIAKRIDKNRLFGAAVHYGRDELGQGGSKIDQDSLTFSLLGRYQAERWGFSGHLSVGSLDYDLKRQISLGSATRDLNGSTDGLQFAAGMQADYAFIHQKWLHGPVLGLEFQHLNIDGYDESSTAGDSASIRYSEQTQTSVTANVGWQARWQGEKWQPFGKLNWLHALEDADDAVEAALVSMPNNRFSLPAVSEDSGYASLTLGTDMTLTDSAKLSISVNQLFGNDQLDETRLQLGIRGQF